MVVIVDDNNGCFEVAEVLDVLGWGRSSTSYYGLPRSRFQPEAKRS